MFRKKKPEPQQLIIEVNKADAKKPSEPETRTQKLVLTDVDGNTRAMLQCAGGGAVALTFHDDSGKMGMLLGLDPNQSPAMALVKDGKMKANLGLDKKTNEPALTLNGPDKSKVEVGYDKAETASLRLHDNEGNVRLSLSLTAKGEAQVKLFDRKGYTVKELKDG